MIQNMAVTFFFLAFLVNCSDGTDFSQKKRVGIGKVDEKIVKAQDDKLLAAEGTGDKKEISADETVVALDPFGAPASVEGSVSNSGDTTPTSDTTTNPSTTDATSGSETTTPTTDTTAETSDASSETTAKVDPAPVESFVAPFHAGIIACQSATFSGSAVFNSYNSKGGAQGLGNGSIISLMDSAHILLKDSVSVKGNVITYGNNSNVVMSGSAVVSGNAETNYVRATGAIQISGDAAISVKTSENQPGVTVTNGCDPIGIPAIFKKFASKFPAPEPVVLVSADDLELDPGTYAYDGMSLTGSSSLILNGPGAFYIYIANGKAFSAVKASDLILNNGAILNLYVSGTMKIGGESSVNIGGKPADLFIFSNYSGAGNGIELSGLSDLVAVVYAPFTDILFTADNVVRGSFRGKNIANAGFGDFHYDEDLAGVNIPKQ